MYNGGMKVKHILARTGVNSYISHSGAPFLYLTRESYDNRAPWCLYDTQSIIDATPIDWNDDRSALVEKHHLMLVDEVSESIFCIPSIQRIVCAANRDPLGRIALGARHCDTVMIRQIKAFQSIEHSYFDEQGFIDQWGNFLDRYEAMEVAKRQNQFHGSGVGYESEKLFSEHLY